MNIPSETEGDFDFSEVHLFARRYLETYYLGVNADEPPIAAFLVEKFRQMPSDVPALEIGCGPTIHHALTIAPYVSYVDFAEYLTDNLDEIRLWKEVAPSAFSWHHYTEMVLAAAGISTDEMAIQARETLLRKKIRQLYICDVTKSPPFAASDTYPIVLSFYCAEEVGTTSESWISVLRNITMMVSPGGHLFLSALRGTQRYVLGNPIGAHEWLPCAHVTKEGLRRCLSEIGYEPETIDIRSVDTPGLVDFGIPGILMAAARKQGENFEHVSDFE